MTDPTPSTAPTDEELTASIVNFDPIDDVPGPMSYKPSSKISEPTLAALPPEKQQEIRAKLSTIAAGNREAFEHKFLMEALRENSYRLRVLAGPGERADPYQRECFGILREVHDLDKEAGAIRIQLDEKQIAADPVTGEPVELPFPVIADPTRRAAMEERFRSLTYQSSLLMGSEGEKRRAVALEEAKAQARSRHEQWEDQKEIERRAKAKAREDRIDREAGVRARSLGPTAL